MPGFNEFLQQARKSAAEKEQQYKQNFQKQSSDRAQFLLDYEARKIDAFRRLMSDPRYSIIEHSLNDRQISTMLHTVWKTMDCFETLRIPIFGKINSKLSYPDTSIQLIHELNPWYENFDDKDFDSQINLNGKRGKSSLSFALQSKLDNGTQYYLVAFGSENGNKKYIECSTRTDLFTLVSGNIAGGGTFLDYSESSDYGSFSP